MAGKPASSSHEPPRQWEEAPVILIYQWKNIREGRVGVHCKYTILRLNEASGCLETLY